MSRKKSKNRFGCIIFLLGILCLATALTLFLIQNPFQATVKSALSPLMRQVTGLNLPVPGLPVATPQPRVAYSFAILSDTHEDTTYFPKIINQIAQRPNFVFVAHLGDLSNAGDKAKLQQAKNILDQLSQPVYVLPGDHDYNWLPQHDLTNFKQVFHEQQTYFSFNRSTEHFLFIDNSNLNTGIDQTQWQWITDDLTTNHQPHIYVFLSTPLSNPYLTFKRMGSQNDQVANQAQRLAKLLQEHHITAMFAGDTHTFSQYPDNYTGIPTITVGAAGSTKNLLPLYVVVEILANGGYNVASVPYTRPIPVQGTD